MRWIPLMLSALSATLALPAREANEQYRQLLAAIAYNHLTIGVSNKEAYSTEGGFAPFFLGFNACTRTNLGAPFTPDTELMLIYSVHGGSILGVRYIVHSADPAAWAPLEVKAATSSPPGKASPRRDNRPRKISRARRSRLLTVPTGKPSCRAARS